MRIEVYSDGAAIKNGGPGGVGWAAVVLRTKGTFYEYAEGEWEEPNSSNNRAELLGIKLGVESVAAEDRGGTDLLIFSDSEWSVKAIRGEYRISCHVELVQEIRALLRLFRSAEVSWVRGHVGHVLNERAHRLANSEARKADRRERTCREKGPGPGLLLQRTSTTRKASSGTCSPGLLMSGSEHGSGSCSQARLDRIAKPSLLEFRTYVKWKGRFWSEPQTYTNEALRERLQELEATLPALETDLSAPPANWTGGQWTQAHDSFLKLRGQRDAIQETLARRARPTLGIPVEEVYRLGGSTSGPGLSPSISTEAQERDPFTEEV